MTEIINCPDLIKGHLLGQIKKHCFDQKPPGQVYTLKSGGTSPYYLDLRKAFLTPDVSKLLIPSISLLIPEDCDCVAGVELGGALALPALTYHSTLSNTRPLNSLVVRKEQKKHGAGGNFAGNLPSNNSHILLIEDTMSTGGSALKAMQVLIQQGYKKITLLVVVDRSADFNSSECVAFMDDYNFDFIPMFSFKDVIDYQLK